MYEKIKDFFKKYKSIIVAVGSAITAMLGVNYFRNRAVERNLQRINDQLSESDRIIEQQQLANSELAKQLEQSRSIVSELRSKFEASKRTAGELQVIDSELTEESRKTGEVLDKLRNFIDTNSSTK